MIVRAVHSKEQPYLMVSKDTIRSGSLRCATLGLLIRLLDLPDNWRFNIRDLASRFHLGKNTVARYLEELREAGYCRVAKIRLPSGRFEAEYTVYEKPGDTEAACPQSRDRETDPTCPQNGDVQINNSFIKESREASASHGEGRTPHSRIRDLFFGLYKERTGAERAPFNPACAGQLKNDLARLGEARLGACLRWLFDHPPVRMQSFAYMSLHTFLPEAEAALAAEERRRSLTRTCPSCGREQEHTGTDCIFCHLPLNGGQNVA